MDNTTIHATFHTILHKLQRILRSIPAVDHKRHLFFPGDFHLRKKHLLLNLMLLFFLMPVIIQPNLPNCNRFWQLTQTTNLFQCILCHLLCIVRVNSKRAIYKRIFFHQLFRCFQALNRSTCIYNMSDSMFFHGIQ